MTRRFIDSVRQILTGGAGAASGRTRDLLVGQQGGNGAAIIESPLSGALTLERTREETDKDPREIRRTHFVTGCRELAEHILVLGDNRISVSANPAKALALSEQLAKKESFGESALACGLVFEVLALGFGWKDMQNPPASEIEAQIEAHCNRRGIENVYGRKGGQKAYGIVEGLVRLVQGGFIVGTELTEFFGRAISCEFFGRARNLFFDGMELATPSGREFIPLVESLTTRLETINACTVLTCIAARCEDEESRRAAVTHLISVERTGPRYLSAAVNVILTDLVRDSTFGDVSKALYEAGFRRPDTTRSFRLQPESDAVREIHDNRRGWATKRLPDGTTTIVRLEFNEY